MTDTKLKKKKKLGRVISQRSTECRNRRDREVRDLYNMLRKRYNYYVVLEWFEANYFVQEYTLMQMIKRSDNRPIDLSKASITYITATKPDFHL